MRGWSVALAILLAGCVGGGGRGGGAMGDGTGPDGVFFGAGGAGEDAGNFRDGRDGCDMLDRDGQVILCGMALQVEGAGFLVVAVNQTEPMSWTDLRMATSEPGFTLRSAAGSAPFTQSVQLPQRDHGPAGYEGPKQGADVDAVLAGPITVGDAFDVCGPGTATLWVWDERPIGAMFGIRVDAPGCDGSPFKPPPVTLEGQYTLNVTGIPTGDVYSQFPRNCLGFPQGVPFHLEAEATWSAQTPLSERLLFRVSADGATPLENVSGSPARIVFDSPGGATRLAVYPPEGSGAALDQSVDVQVRVVFETSPTHLLGPGPGSCPRA